MKEAFDQLSAIVRDRASPYNVYPPRIAFSGRDGCQASEMEASQSHEEPLFTPAGFLPVPADAVDLLSVDKVSRDSTLCSLHRETTVLWELLQFCFSNEVMEVHGPSYDLSYL